MDYKPAQWVPCAGVRVYVLVAQQPSCTICLFHLEQRPLAHLHSNLPLGGAKLSLGTTPGRRRTTSELVPGLHATTSSPLSMAAPLCGRARPRGRLVRKWPLCVIRLRSQVMDFTLSYHTLHPNCTQGAVGCESVCVCVSAFIYSTCTCMRMTSWLITD